MTISFGILETKRGSYKRAMRRVARSMAILGGAGFPAFPTSSQIVRRGTFQARQTRGEGGGMGEEAGSPCLVGPRVLASEKAASITHRCCDCHEMKKVAGKTSYTEDASI